MHEGDTVYYRFNLAGILLCRWWWQGGYLDFDWCLMGDARPGPANKIIALFVRTMCVSFSEMSKNLVQKKVICTGLPLRRELLSKKNNTVPFKRVDKPLLYIGGGTTGSFSMNGLIFDSLSFLLEDFQVVHQTESIV